MGRGLIALFLLSGCDAVFDLEHVEPGAVIGATCDADGECMRGGVQGRCECGFCSYSDSQCAGTSRRWNEGAGALADTCVPAVDDVDATVFHTCAALTDGTAWCWGSSLEGQLGAAQPVGVNSNVPVQVATASGDILRDVDEISVGAAHSCALRRDGTVVCWGSNQFGGLGAGLPLGEGTRSVDPVQVVTQNGALTNVTQLAVGYFFACALVEAAGQADAIYCWGANGRDQLGVDLLPDSPIAVQRPLAGDVKTIDVGGEHACAVTDGNTYCWGRRANGRLGNNDGTEGAISTPQRVVTSGLVALPAVTRLALGNRHSCAVKMPPGEFYCWGDNAEGQLGDGSTDQRTIATRVVGIASSDDRSLSAGDRHTCGLIGSDTWCWGADGDGQVGDGNADTTRKQSPVRVIAGDRQREVTAGFAHTCALGADYKLRCWGANQDGQLGTGDTAATHAPTEIATTGFCPR